MRLNGGMTVLSLYYSLHSDHRKMEEIARWDKIYSFIMYLWFVFL